MGAELWVRPKRETLRSGACSTYVSAYILALSGEGVGFADSAGEVVIVNVIVDVIDCPKLDYVND